MPSVCENRRRRTASDSQPQRCARAKAAKNYIDDTGTSRDGKYKLVRDPGMQPEDRMCGIPGPFGYYRNKDLSEGMDHTDPIHMVNVDSLIAALAYAFWFNGGARPNPHVSMLKAFMLKLDRTELNKFLPAHAGRASVQSVFELLGPGEALRRMPKVEKQTATQLARSVPSSRVLTFERHSCRVVCA